MEVLRRIWRTREQHSSDEVEKAKFGARLFTRASSEYPASIAGQAVAVAIACKKEGIVPGEIGRSFLQSQYNINNVVAAAAQAHHHRGVGATVNEQSVRDIAVGVFGYADALMEVDDEELFELQERYFHFRKMEDTGDLEGITPEDLYRYELGEAFVRSRYWQMDRASGKENNFKDFFDQFE